MLLIAFMGVSLAVALPQFLWHGWRRGLLSLFAVALAAMAVWGLLVFFVWIAGDQGSEGHGRKAKTLRALGHGLRFLFFGLVTAILGVALVGGHGLGRTVEDTVSLGSGLAGAFAGLLLRRRLGPSRFWVAFRRFGWALLGSFVGGILGILGPEGWGITLGILVPLLVFAILACLGRIVPREAP